MKKLFFVLCTFALLTSCTKSKEERAAEIAEKAIKANAYYPDTYQVQETKVDSAYHTVFLDSEVLQAAYKLVEFDEEVERLETEINREKKILAIYAPMPYFDPASSKEGRRQANEKIEKAQVKLDKITNKIVDKEEIIKKRFEEIGTPKFAGWLITQKYSLKNGDGQRIPCEKCIVTDKDMEEIIMEMDPEDHKLLSAFDRINKVLGFEE